MAISFKNSKAGPSTGDPSIMGSQPEGKITLQRKSGKSITKSSDTAVSVGPVVNTVAPMANVGMSVKVTKNLGNFESLQVSVSLNMPSLPEETDETFASVKEWVDGKMEKIMTEVNNNV